MIWLAGYVIGGFLSLRPMYKVIVRVLMDNDLEDSVDRMMAVVFTMFGAVLWPLIGAGMLVYMWVAPNKKEESK